MLSYTQDYNDAIRSEDREIRGCLIFNGMLSKTMDGETGLISFSVNENAAKEERFGLGNVCSSYCEANFFNSGIPSGVNLKESFFDAYIGVVTGKTTNTKLNRSIGFISPNQYTTIAYGGVSFNLVPAGTYLTVVINNTIMTGEWTSNKAITVNNGVLKYDLYVNGDDLRFSARNISTNAFVYGTYNTYVYYIEDTVDYKCMGRFYVTNVDSNKSITTITGYDVANKLNVKYVPTVTFEEDGDYYVATKVLNDIISQTGVNESTPYPISGASTQPLLGYWVTNIFDGTCAQQWGWLWSAGTLSEAVTVCVGSRTNLGYMDAKSYQDGATYYDDYPALDDTVIYEDGVKLGETFTITSLTTGTDDKPIIIGSGNGINSYNPYADTTWSTQLFNNRLDGITYTPMTIEFRGDPCIELMDSLKVTHDGTDYRCIVMKITTTFNGGLKQSIECFGFTDETTELANGYIANTIRSTADYVVSSKISSPWNYRKWNSGYVDLWCRRTFQNLSFTQDGSVYVADIPSFSYPFDLLMTNSIIETVTAAGVSTTPDTAVWIRNKGGGTGPTHLKTGQYQAVKTTSGSATIHVNYDVHARMVGTLS